MFLILFVTAISTAKISDWMFHLDSGEAGPFGAFSMASQAVGIVVLSTVFEPSHCSMMLSHSSWPLRLHRGLEESIGPVIAPADVAQEINITIHVARESRFTGLASCRTGPSPGGIPQTERTRWSVEAESGRLGRLGTRMTSPRVK